MGPLHSLVCLALCLAQPPAARSPDLPQGLHGLTCRVLALEGQDLLVALAPAPPERSRLRVRVTAASRFRLFDLGSGKGEPSTVSKDIRREDLKVGQKVVLTVYCDGTDAYLLDCVATGPGLSGERALQRILALGGTYRDMRFRPDGKEAPRWAVNLSKTKAGDPDLAELARLPGLSTLDLSFTAVTDAGLHHLRAVRELNDLDLIGTKVTAAARPTLRQLPRLRSLAVARTPLADLKDELVRDFPDLELCRIATGAKGQFQIREQFRQGKLHQTILMIGDTFYACEFPGSRRATTYYHRDGPVGQVLAPFAWFGRGEDDSYPADARLPAALLGLCARTRLLPGEFFPGEAIIGLWSEPALGVIRLNGGTHASYGRPQQFFDFYNSPPELTAFSVPPPGQSPRFHFVQDARQRGCNVRILAGDERQTLARQGPRRFYSALFVEITREDLRDVNTALLTKEGMAELMGSLREDGLLCYHVSHRWQNFALPLAAAAKALGYSCKAAQDTGNNEATGGAHFGSTWLVVARQPRYLDRLQSAGTVTWSVLAAAGKYLWRDGQPHDLDAIRWERLRPQASADPAKIREIEGLWFGTVRSGPLATRYALHVQTRDGKLTGTFDSLDNQVLATPLTRVEFKDGKLTFNLKGKSGADTYTAWLDASRTVLEGAFQQGGLTVPVNFRKVDKLPDLARPQQPKRPFPYRELPVSFANPKAGITFAGTLTLPQGDGPFPAVLLLSGSGPMDRNSTYGYHKPFLVLADYLTRRGIAVLRVDDRGVGETKGGSVWQSTLTDFAEDALLAFAFLKNRKDINPAKIGLIGHSQGGLVAALAAAQAPDVAFVILLGASGRVGRENQERYFREHLKKSGLVQQRAQEIFEEYADRINKIVLKEKDQTRREAAIRAAGRECYAKLPGFSTLPEKEQKALLAKDEEMIRSFSSPWFRSMQTSDAGPVLTRVQCPVLALTGELDVRVPAKENLPRIEKFLRAGGNKDVTVKVLPLLNHNFQTAPGVDEPRYALIEESFAPSALQLISEWILRRK